MAKRAAPQTLGEGDHIAPDSFTERIEPSLAVMRDDDDLAFVAAVFCAPSRAFPAIELPTGTLEHRSAIDALTQRGELVILRHRYVVPSATLTA
jgi:hypothetical protein